MRAVCRAGRAPSVIRAPRIDRGSPGRVPRTPPRRRSRAARRLPGAALALTLLVPGAAAGQAQAEVEGAREPAQQARLRADTIPGDSLAADTTLTVRERALRRLRAMPRSPIQPDTTAADSLVADSLAADSLVADSLGADSLAADRVRADTTGVPTDTAGPGAAAADSVPGDSARLRPTPPDTIGIPVGEEGVVIPTDSAAQARDTDPGPVMESAVREQLQALQGYVTTEYEGERATFWADSNHLELTGESRVAREGNTLETDSLIVYDGESGVVCGYGAPVLSGEGEDPVTSNRVCFDIERDVGMAEGAETQFSQGATWYVRGADNRVFVLPGAAETTLYGERAHFTSCELEDPHYSFSARSLKMIEGDMMVARNVTLRFADVPVFWLPWMWSSMKSGRRSGLLMPQFGVNDIVRNSSDYNRHLSNIGFYWALNNYVSTRGTFEWYSGNWMAVEGALTYRWRRQFLQGSLRTKHYWRQREGEPAGRELTLNTSNSWEPDERTRLRFDANYASSTDFVRTNSFDPRELNRSIRSSASVNRSFDWGSLTLGADRRQQLTTNQVDMTLPSLRLSLSPITLLSSESGFNITWTGSGNATRSTRDVMEDSLPSVRDAETRTGAFSQSLSLGRFSVSQSVNYDEEILGPKPLLGGTGSLPVPSKDEPPGFTGLPRETSESLGWSMSTGYQLGLWVGTSLSPSVSISGQQVRNDRTRTAIDTLAAIDSVDLGGVGAGDFVSQPYRLSAGASLSTAIYGFWPGFGNFSRIRHKIAPTVRWSYSPQPTVTPLQAEVFGTNLREQNRITLSFSQTFEAKVESDDTASTDSVELGQPGEPRRLPQAEKITLLALNTGTSFVYDFVAAQEDGRGFMPSNDQVNNSIRSDLLQGLQLNVSHDLFDEDERPAGGGLAPRRFAPFLTNLSASFSIDNEFWLFRFLGLSSGDEREPADTVQADTLAQDGLEGMGAESSSSDIGSMVPGGGRGPTGPGGRPGLGRWRASLSYSLRRNRLPGGEIDRGNEMLQANISFDPTEHWSVRWSTAYSFTESEFANHILTLTRDLHRWEANFDFVKAQNGNFIMQFRVQLRDNPDLKLDYDQQERAQRAPGIPPGVR